MWAKKKIEKENFINIPRWKDIRIRVKGKNNKVIIPQNMQGKIKIFIHGDNNTLIIKSEKFLDIKVYIGAKTTPCNNASFEIGRETEINDANFMLLENNSSITIGDDCLFGYDIKCWCSDTHSICDLEGKVLNIGKSIEIGNHVWIGRDCHLTKNTRIPDNSVVGWCSNVTRKFDEQNVIIAGNPAQIVKRNINWQNARPQELLDRENTQNR